MSARRLNQLPPDLPPPTRHGLPVEYDTVAEVNGVVWAYNYDGVGLGAQEFYYWDRSLCEWVDKTERGSRGRAVPYKTLMRLRET